MFDKGRGPGAAGPFAFCGPYGVRGFSLVELIVVMVLLGIVAAVAMPRWTGGSGFDERVVRDQVVAALRYAQKSAIASRRMVCVTFSSSPARVDFILSSAYPAGSCVGGTALLGPDGTVLSVTSPSVAFSSSVGTLTFDAVGRASSGASITVSGLPAGLAITVESETGYVH